MSQNYPVPEGWKLVPENPTGNMFRAAAKIDNEMFAGGSSHGAEDGQIWDAMIAAAPAAPLQPVQQPAPVAEKQRVKNFRDRTDFISEMLDRRIYLSIEINEDGRFTSSAMDSKFEMYRRQNPAPVPAASVQPIPSEWRELAKQCLTAMKSAVHFRKTGQGRPPEQTCMFEIEALEKMLAVPDSGRDAALSDSTLQKIIEAVGQARNQRLSPTGTLLLVRRLALAAFPAASVAQGEGQQLTHDQVRQIFMANGFTIKDGQIDLKDYVYKAAYSLLDAQRALNKKG